ncbi:MAG: glycosyl transferase, group 1 [Parcubacteria group bacterium Gr01-1014_72]|nr:MAG: glycosyl transferase, group 1 [Parcubacteria group bacterium Gr01-1014_72]
MKVLFLTQFGEKGGSSRIQVIQFLSRLRAGGFTCIHNAIYHDLFYDVHMGLRILPVLRKKLNLIYHLLWALIRRCYFTLTAWRYDVIIIQKDTFPLLLYTLLTTINRRVIYEIDDTIFEINPFHNDSKLNLLLLKYQAYLCKKMMQGAVLVVAENEYLANEARRHNKHVMVLSAPIDVKAMYPRTGERTGSGPVTIGWIGSPSTTYMLEEILSVFQELAKRVGGWRLKTVGARGDFKADGVPLITKPWRLEEQLADLQSFDIGIMPLDDSPFNRGRLGYKMIQYMAVGIPTVAENRGLNKTVIVNGENGFLVSGVSEWVSRLKELIEDASLRARLGKGGRRMAENRFSLERLTEVWREAISRAARL